MEWLMVVPLCSLARPWGALCDSEVGAPTSTHPGCGALALYKWDPGGYNKIPHPPWGGDMRIDDGQTRYTPAP